MNTNTSKSILLLVVVIGWLLHIVLIWAYRFVPSNDYPEWLLQAHILVNYGSPSFDYSRWYALVIAPIPNGGFVIPAAVLSMAVPIEVAGKLVLTSYLIWLPLALRSLYRSMGNHSTFWVIAVALLFNISFFNGNMGFLMGTCLLFSTLSLFENRRRQFSTKDYGISGLLALCIFLSHGVCITVFVLYCTLVLFTQRESLHVRRMALLCLVISAVLTLLYLGGRTANDIPTRFDWQPDLRYRLVLVTKPFFVGWAYPPFEFSLLRFVGTVGFIALGLFMILRALKQVRETFKTSAIAQLVIAITVLTFLGPKQMLGITELSHRFATLWFPLVVGFTLVPSKREREFHLTLAALICLIVVVRWQDYRASSRIIQDRHEFLGKNILPGYPTLTLDDRLGEVGALFPHLVPKGVTFTFQTDYFVLAGGYNPLSFRTFLLSPRDSLIFFLYRDAPRDTCDCLPRVQGSFINEAIQYIVIDAEGSKGREFASRVSSDFEVIAESRITGDIRTLILRRHR